EPERRPSLGDFIATLRGTLNQLLVDALSMKPPAPNVDSSTESAPAPNVDSTTESAPDAVSEYPAQPTTEPQPPQVAPVALRLVVSRQAGPNKFVPVAATRESMEPVVTRDLRKVPPPPEQVRLQTGDRVRLEAVADRPGYLTVFNVGPTGNL